MSKKAKVKRQKPKVDTVYEGGLWFKGKSKKSKPKSTYILSSRFFYTNNPKCPVLPGALFSFDFAVLVTAALLKD